MPQKMVKWLKITIALKIINVLISVIYIILLLIYNLKEVWFSLAIILISVPTLIKAIYFNLDSKLWLGSFLLLNGILGVVKNEMNLSFSIIYPIYILTIGLASFSVFAIFRQNIHLKVFVICFFEVLLLGIYKFALITFVEFLLIHKTCSYLLVNTMERNERKKTNDITNGKTFT